MHQTATRFIAATRRHVYLVWSLFRALLASANHFVNSIADAHGTLVVAQDIALNHTVTLGGAYGEYFRKPDGSLSYQAFEFGPKRIEYYFPLGTPLLLAPAVAIAHGLGYDALAPGGDAAGQRVAVTLLVFLILVVTYAYLRRYLAGRAGALAASGLILFGTIVGPVVATGLWSIDIEVLLIGTVMLMLDAEALQRPAAATALGAVLFLGYLVRPSFALIILATFSTLMLRRQYAALLYSGAVSAALLLGFSQWSRHHFGLNLPPYYLGSRLSTADFANAFLALLASPSRSVFVYSPVLLATFALFAASLMGRRMRLRRDADVICLALAGVGLFLLNALFPKWTGGWSYGPRILTDMAYVGALLAFRITDTMQPRPQRSLRWVRGLLVVGLFAGLQGIYNPLTFRWNAYPDIDAYPQLVWDWRYPQVLTTARLLRGKCATESRELHIEHPICP